MPDRTVPDYPLADVLAIDRADQLKALLDRTRVDIVELLSERAATTSELAVALDRPKGTVGYHLGVLADAELVKVVRTERVRALEAKYYGRTARTFELCPVAGVDVPPDLMLAEAAAEMAALPPELARPDLPALSSLRHARIPTERADELRRRLVALMEEFSAEPRGGDVVYGLAVGLFPTARPRLSDADDRRGPDE